MAIFCACGAVLLLLVHAPSQGFDVDATTALRSANLPNAIFWAWERPEDLRFLEGQPAGVAFLAETVILGSTSDPSQWTVRPRLQPVRVAPSTPLIAVVRIESQAANPRPRSGVSLDPSGVFAMHATISPQTGDQIGTRIAALQNLANVRAIQIDFDATTTQHAFYSALLQEVRRKLPSTIPLSITALASWCIGDRWLNQLPPGTIDEAVPMLFRMGIDAGNVERFLRSGETFGVAACRGSLGVSTDEPLSDPLLTRRLAGPFARRHEKRIYIFAPRAWTRSTAGAAFKEWQP
jgi:Protein of unknown function (DUF3142)